MRSMLIAAFVGAGLLTSACNRSQLSTTTAPTPVSPNPKLPFQVMSATPSPADGATLKLGDGWSINYSVRCDSTENWWVAHYTREDGTTTTDSNFGARCQGTIQNGGGNRTLKPGDILYKFGRGQKVVVRFAMVTNADPYTNVLLLSDREIATWFIAE